jgi:hypothetical protein
MSTNSRNIQSRWKSRPTLEGAGVRLNRAFGFQTENLFDPFLLLDDFHSNNPADYLAGFPWHPHRGIETITYMLHGKIKHGDSLENGGVIGSGDVQWMTAGSGIIHSEMPQQDSDNPLLWGFQLWANLPAKQKMMDPRYRDITAAQIPEVIRENGTKIKIICGEIDGVQGPVRDIMINPSYFDITLPEQSNFNYLLPEDYTCFAYVIEGAACFDESSIKTQTASTPQSLLLFNKGESLSVSTFASSTRFLLVSGKPLNEPIAWWGPIVMNTQEELDIAFNEYRNGTFIKYKKKKK